MTDQFIMGVSILWAFAMGAAVTYAILKRRHAAEIKLWTDPFRDVVHQRDRLQRELDNLQRYHAFTRSRSLYWLTKERATRRYLQDMLRSENETWMAARARVEKVRWN